MLASYLESLEISAYAVDGRCVHVEMETQATLVAIQKTTAKVPAVPCMAVMMTSLVDGSSVYLVQTWRCVVHYTIGSVYQATPHW